MTVADRVANERGEILGDTVGVSVSFIDKYSESTQIKVIEKSLSIRKKAEFLENLFPFLLLVYDRRYIAT